MKKINNKAYLFHQHSNIQVQTYFRSDLIIYSQTLKSGTSHLVMVINNKAAGVMFLSHFIFMSDVLRPASQSRTRLFCLSLKVKCQIKQSFHTENHTHTHIHNNTHTASISDYDTFVPIGWNRRGPVRVLSCFRASVEKMDASFVLLRPAFSLTRFPLLRKETAQDF